ncbi:uncharacterized protein LOC135836930 isoform X2 [Planococcus citri]|uniref:uncharacterized protein LOC135836930 isoform X2 n=1 Tax=Planococcus citri TaxID=170843 RepID=UPI0031F9875A
MTRNPLILFVVLISCSVSSIGLEIPYRNNSLLTLCINHHEKNFTIPCSDVDEVEWLINTNTKAKNFIQVLAPNKKNVVIKDANMWDTGVYKCFSKNNPAVFMKVVLRVQYRSNHLPFICLVCHLYLHSILPVSTHAFLVSKSEIHKRVSNRVVRISTLLGICPAKDG